ncbi:hypothetical protein KY285_020386 [Solanum tuberosum]|nr:hypothetical protein KY285_020386 [Solanum tuberosum]
MAKKLEKFIVREHLRVAELKSACGKRILQNSGMPDGYASRSWLRLFEMCSEGIGPRHGLRLQNCVTCFILDYK